MKFTACKQPAALILSRLEAQIVTMTDQDEIFGENAFQFIGTVERLYKLAPVQ